MGKNEDAREENRVRGVVETMRKKEDEVKTRVGHRALPFLLIKDEFFYGQYV